MILFSTICLLSNCFLENLLSNIRLEYHVVRFKWSSCLDMLKSFNNVKVDVNVEIGLGIVDEEKE